MSAAFASAKDRATFRWSEERSERISEIVAVFVRRKVDIIVTGGNAVLVAKLATSVIPAIAHDPVFFCAGPGAFSAYRSPNE